MTARQHQWTEAYPVRPEATLGLDADGDRAFASLVAASQLRAWRSRAPGFSCRRRQPQPKSRG